MTNTNTNRVIYVTVEVTKTILTIAICAALIAGIIGGLIALSILGGEWIHTLVVNRPGDR